MRRYEPSTPRAAAALTAVAMAALTIGSMVVLPAQFDSVRVDPYEMEAERARRGVAEVAIGPGRSEAPVAAERDDVAHADRTAFAAKEPSGKRHPWSARSRTHT